MPQNNNYRPFQIYEFFSTLKAPRYGSNGKEAKCTDPPLSLFTLLALIKWNWPRIQADIKG